MSAAFERRMEGLGALRDEPLAAHAFVRIGGPADWFLRAETAEQMADAVEAARNAGVPVLALGRGSNLLVGDAGIRGLVVRAPGTVGEPSVRGDAVELEADAGAYTFALARCLAERGIRGLEWAEGVPGTLGGGAVTNAGAYGGCFADVLAEVEAVDAGGRREWIGADALGLAYRGSAFSRGELPGRLITRVRLLLRAGDADEALARVAEVQRDRRETKPLGSSLGSTFKNLREGGEISLEERAWWLLDQAGMRGERIGAVEASPKHPNYFVNLGGASARDYAALMRLARERVRERFGAELEPEVSFAGEGFE